MTKLPLSPELEEYIAESNDEFFHNKKSKADEKYDELELKFIKENWFDAYGKEPTEAEIEDQKIELTKLKYLVETWMDEYFEQVGREHRLESEPKGFHLEKDDMICKICNRRLKANDTWFDKLGVKCMTCKKALKEKVIPMCVYKNRKSWYSIDEMKKNFELDTNTLLKKIKSGEIVSRDIMTIDGKSLYFRLFMVRENDRIKISYFTDQFDRINRGLDAKKKMSVNTTV